MVPLIQEVLERATRIGRKVDRDELVRTGKLGEKCSAPTVEDSELDNRVRLRVAYEVFVALDLLPRLDDAEPIRARSREPRRACTRVGDPVDDELLIRGPLQLH